MGLGVTEPALPGFANFWHDDQIISNKEWTNFTKHIERCDWSNIYSAVDNAEISVLKSAKLDNNYQNSLHVARYPKVEDMQYWFLVAIVLIFVRIVIERYVFLPLAKHLGINDQPRRPYICRISEAVPVLEDALSSSKTFSSTKLDKLCLETGLKVREIERWIRMKRRLNRPSLQKKFTESGWRCVSYIISTLIGIGTVWNKPWLTNSDLLLKDHENHKLTTGIWLYYSYGAGLYLSYLVTQAFDVKRKDFWEMFMHHVITVGFFVITWPYNLTRITVYALLLHDCSDSFLELAKMANYIKKQDLSTAIFVIFTILWTITRLIIYPKNVVWNGAKYLIGHDKLPPAISYLLVCMLVSLLALHIFWTYFIVKVAISALKSDKSTQKDARSSSESEDVSIGESDVEMTENPAKNNLRGKKRFSLQYDSATKILVDLNRKQRTIMKRISIEIM